MQAIILLIALMLASPAFAQVGDQPKSRQTPTWILTNCNAAAVNAARNCELRITTSNPQILGVEGYNIATLEIYYDWAAGTGIGFIFQACNEGMSDNDCTDTTDWFDVQSISLSAGTATLSDYTISKTAGADDYFALSIGLNYRRLRLANILASGSPTASDKITVKARLGSVPAM